MAGGAGALGTCGWVRMVADCKGVCVCVCVCVCERLCVCVEVWP